MSDLDLDALEAVAQAATPGPWSAANEHELLGPDAEPAWCISRMRPGYESMTPTEGYMYDIAETSLGSRDASDGPNAAHIATFDPPTVLALIAELRDSRARLAEVEAERDEWRDVSVGPAYATLLRERTQTAEQKAAALEAERDDLSTLLDNVRSARDANGYLALAIERERDDALAKVAALAKVIEALLSALERTEANFRSAVNGKPVRDMVENLDENRRDSRARIAAPTPPAEAACCGLGKGCTAPNCTGTVKGD